MSIFHLSQLSFLSLASNELTGSIPEAVGNLTQLTYLVLGKNRFTGNIPRTISNLSKLEYLSLEYNNLSVTIFLGVSLKVLVVCHQLCY